MKRIFVFVLIVNLFYQTIYSQGVLVSSDLGEPDASSILEVRSTSSGVLFPRMTTNQRDNILNPVNSLIIFNTETDCFEAYSEFNNDWLPIACLGGGSSGSDFINCGDDLTDLRDGQIYKTVQIGSQCWMAENLNYAPPLVDSYCYGQDPTNCAIYGRLYAWGVAMGGSPASNSDPSGVQGICPAGWHIPSDLEWDKLESFVGSNPATQLKAGTPDWNGNNSSGFTALAGGSKFTNLAFGNLGNYGFWWSTTEYSTNNAKYRSMGSGVSISNPANGTGKTYGYSLRCILD